MADKILLRACIIKFIDCLKLKFDLYKIFFIKKIYTQCMMHCKINCLAYKRAFSQFKSSTIELKAKKHE